MSNPKDNIDALKIYENEKFEECPEAPGGTPFRWAGTVKKNHGKYKRINEKGEDIFSGEWIVEIESPSLEQTVFARANEERKAGEEAQFNLTKGSDIYIYEYRGVDGRVAEAPRFKRQRDHSNPKPGPWEDTPGWREGMVYE